MSIIEIVLRFHTAGFPKRFNYYGRTSVDQYFRGSPPNAGADPNFSPSRSTIVLSNRSPNCVSADDQSPKFQQKAVADSFSFAGVLSVLGHSVRRIHTFRACRTRARSP